MNPVKQWVSWRLGPLSRFPVIDRGGLTVVARMPCSGSVVAAITTQTQGAWPTFLLHSLHAHPQEVVIYKKFKVMDLMRGIHNQGVSIFLQKQIIMPSKTRKHLDKMKTIKINRVFEIAQTSLPHWKTSSCTSKWSTRLRAPPRPDVGPIGGGHRRLSSSPTEAPTAPISSRMRQSRLLTSHHQAFSP